MQLKLNLSVGSGAIIFELKANIILLLTVFAVSSSSPLSPMLQLQIESTLHVASILEFCVTVNPLLIGGAPAPVAPILLTPLPQTRYGVLVYHRMIPELVTGANREE